MEKHPLMSFEDRNDYLLHCDWSPSHPALFATVAMTGHLDIWNLNMNSEVSVAADLTGFVCLKVSNRSLELFVLT